MKTIKGVIDIGLSNRLDGTPLLRLEAIDTEGKKYLHALNDALNVVWLEAVSKGKADINNVCGSIGNSTEMMSMSIPLALGGVELFVPRKKARRK